LCIDCSRLSRRHFLALGAAGAVACHGIMPAAAQQTAPTPPNAISPDDALKRIMDGNARYASNISANRDFSAGRMARASAQYPIVGIVGCADSRVAPEFIFDQGPGELFVVRLAGNFVDKDGLASLEYAIRFLGISLVMVLGHSGCGAVDATIKVLKDNLALPGHLPELVSFIKPAVEAAKLQNPTDLLAAATAENVRFNVTKLMASEPIVKSSLQEGKLKVVGGVYDIGTGTVNLV
jgi:carbonic anhydrase